MLIWVSTRPLEFLATLEKLVDLQPLPLLTGSPAQLSNPIFGAVRS